MAILGRIGNVRAVSVVAALLLAAMMLVLVDGRARARELEAQFPQVKGLYEGDSVTLLGVKIGTVTQIVPHRDTVTVRMRIDDDIQLPADVRAAISAPALVAVRTVALGPAYEQGPTLAEGAAIPLSRTVVPVEWDEIKAELTRLSEALGPDGVDEKGSLGRLVTASRGYLDGHGASLQRTIVDLSEAMTTLSDNRGEIFATVRNLQVFIAALESSDQQMRTFNTRLDTVSSALAQDRGALARALEGLRRAFEDIQAFLDDNRDLTTSTLESLRATTQVLAENRQGLADILQLAPTSVSNFYNILDPRNAAPTGVLALSNLNAPAQIICAALLNLAGSAEQCQATIGPLAQYLALDAPNTGILPPLAVPGTSGTTPPDSGSKSGGASGVDPESIEDLHKGLDSLLGGGTR